MFYLISNQILFCLHRKTGPQEVSWYFNAHHSSFNHAHNPPCLNNPAGQLHLYVNTHLGSEPPHMATNNLQKSLELSSKLCSSQFGQICLMPLSYSSGADVRAKYVSWQEPSVWSLRFPLEETRLMDAKMFFYEERQTEIGPVLCSEPCGLRLRPSKQHG